MQLAKNRFKQTRNGGIPEGWKESVFGDMAELIKDGYKPTGKDSLAYIGLEHINQQLLSLNSIGHSTEVGSNKFAFQSGDILFGKLRPYFRKVYRPSFEGVCSTDIWVVRAKEGVDQGYLFYLMASQEFVDLASSGSSGTRMPRADWEHLKDTMWPRPPIVQQRAIAQILSDLDAKIELNHQMNKTLEQIAQAIFKQWFIGFEFPGHEKIKFVDGLPEGWQEKPLDQIADFLNGLALQKFPPKGKDYLPVIKIRELNQGITDSSDKASTEIDSSYIVNDGDVLFSWSGSLEVVLWGHGRGALNQHLFKVTSQEYPKWFYYFWVKEHLSDFRLIAEGKATTMGHIQRHHLSQAMVLVPKKEHLQMMTAVAEPILNRVINNLIEIRQLRQIRDSLLPKLMSGKKRVML